MHRMTYIPMDRHTRWGSLDLPTSTRCWYKEMHVHLPFENTQDQTQSILQFRVYFVSMHAIPNGRDSNYLLYTDIMQRILQKLSKRKLVKHLCLPSLSFSFVMKKEIQPKKSNSNNSNFSQDFLYFSFTWLALQLSKTATTTEDYRGPEDYYYCY